MNDTATGFDQADEEILGYDVSDEALEAAAGIGSEYVSMAAGSCYMPGGMVC